MTDTRRPLKMVPSTRSELERELDDYAETLGKVMSAVGRVERDIVNIRVEHETYTRTVVQTQITLEEMLDEQRSTKAAIGRSQKLIPLAITLIELLRQVAHHYGVF